MPSNQSQTTDTQLEQPDLFEGQEEELTVDDIGAEFNQAMDQIEDDTEQETPLSEALVGDTEQLEEAEVVEQKPLRPRQIEAIKSKYGGNVDEIAKAKSETDRAYNDLRQDYQRIQAELQQLRQNGTERQIAAGMQHPQSGQSEFTDEQLENLTPKQLLELARSEVRTEFKNQMGAVVQTQAQNIQTERELMSAFPSLQGGTVVRKVFDDLASQGRIPTNTEDAVIYTAGINAIFSDNTGVINAARSEGALKERTRKAQAVRASAESGNGSTPFGKSKKVQLTANEMDAAKLGGAFNSAEEYKLFQGDDTAAQLAYLKKQRQKKGK